MDRACKFLDTSLAVDTNVKVHATSDDLKKLLEIVLLAVRGNPQIVNSQELANTIWAFATAGVMPQSLFRAIATNRH